MLTRLSELEKAVKTANGSFVSILLTQNLTYCLERGDHYKEMAHDELKGPGDLDLSDSDAGNRENGADSNAGENDRLRRI